LLPGIDGQRGYFVITGRLRQCEDMNDSNPPSQLLVRSRLGYPDGWLFDLDNTLYPATSNLFDQVDRRMGTYISNLLGISRDCARVLQKRYYRDYGSTLSGLMRHHGADPDAFLEYVHNIDLGAVGPSPVLAAALSRLPGRKFVFTNGSVGHAERVMGRLGVASYFEGIHDIKASAYQPKPESAAYHSVMTRFGLTAKSLIMVDDIPTNLEPASALGITTVWVRHDGWADYIAGDHIDYVTDNLAGWLAQIVFD